MIGGITLVSTPTALDESSDDGVNISAIDLGNWLDIPQMGWSALVRGAAEDDYG